MPLRSVPLRTSILFIALIASVSLVCGSGCQPKPAPQRGEQADSSTPRPSRTERPEAPADPTRAKAADSSTATTTATGPAIEPATPAIADSARTSQAPQAAPAAPVGSEASTDADPLAPAPPALPQGPPTKDDAGGRAWLSMSDLPYEYWETQYLNAQRIGVTHYKVEKAGAQRLTLTATTTLELQRGGETIRQTVTVQTIERSDGQVDSYFEDIQGAGATSKATGSVSDAKMPLRITKGESTTTATIPWPSGTWGPMGVHQLLLRQPMRSGEHRVAHVFLPQIHKTARVTLVAGKEEKTTAPDGLLGNLLPIDVVMQLDNEAISNRLWVNAQGQAQKSVMTVGLNLSSYRVSREVAERVVAQGQVDLFEATSIQLKEPLVDPERAERIVYTVEAKTSDPFALLSRESNQSVRSESAFKSELTVWRPSADGQPPEGPRQTPPTPECLASSSLIKSDDPLIAKLATRLAEGASEPAAVVRKLTEGVYASIRKKNFSRSFDSAQDVARTLEGDCTEHAVLLAALLRNRGIPARLASGIVVETANERSACVYHMWTEAWLGSFWLPLDATRGGLAGCGHIKFLETPLADSNPYSALLPVMTSLGQLSISVKDVVP